VGRHGLLGIERAGGVLVALEATSEGGGRPGS